MLRKIDRILIRVPQIEAAVHYYRDAMGLNTPIKPPALPGDSIERQEAVLGDDLGKRDRLPYTDRFDELVDGFNKTLQRPLSPHLIWRAVATLAK